MLDSGPINLIHSPSASNKSAMELKRTRSLCSDGLCVNNWVGAELRERWLVPEDEAVLCYNFQLVVFFSLFSFLPVPFFCLSPAVWRRWAVSDGSENLFSSNGMFECYDSFSYSWFALFLLFMLWRDLLLYNYRSLDLALALGDETWHPK